MDGPGRATLVIASDLPGARVTAVDLIWSEGAIYIMGFSAGLRAWRRLLRPRGVMVITEATWFTHSPSGPARRFWADACPAMTDVGACRRSALEEGYEVIATYRLPDEDWWREYYSPLTARLDALGSVEDGVLADVVAEERREIDLRRDHGDEYGYTGFVMCRTD